MRSILFGILALLALIVISALGVPGALAQGGGKSQRDGPQAPVGHSATDCPGCASRSKRDLGRSGGEKGRR